MDKRKKVAFVAHWVEPNNWLLWFCPFLHRWPELHRWLVPLAPLYWLVSLWYLVGKKSYDIVDQYRFNGKIIGLTILVRDFAWHFFFKSQRDRIRERIMLAVLEAQEKGAEVIGLGALTKAEWLTRGGKWLVDELGEKLKVPIVHGDTLTAATVFEQTRALIRHHGIKTPIFLTGATSKIGRAVAITLAQNGIEVVMYTKSRERFEQIKAEAGESGDRLFRAVSLKEGKGCSLWITGKSIPARKDLLRFVPQGAVVLNFSVPNPIDRKSAKQRKDLVLVEGGLLAYDPARTDLRFTMRLRPGLTYACHAGTMVHAMMDWPEHEVGPVDLARMPLAWEAARKLGFHLPVVVEKPRRARSLIPRLTHFLW